MSIAISILVAYNNLRGMLPMNNSFATFQDFARAVTGHESIKKLPQELSHISNENLRVAKSLVNLAKKLEGEGKIAEANELKHSIRSLLDSNDRLIKTLNYAAATGA